MRAEWEFRAKLAEALEKAGPKSRKPFLYWEQEASLCRWALEDPEPVIDKKVRARAQANANLSGTPRYLWADDKGTWYSNKPTGHKCELVEPQ